MNKLATDTKKVTRVLAGKTVKAVRRHRATELLILFTDGTRLLVDQTTEGLELTMANEFDGDIEAPSSATRH
jgi:hypothetical protein